MSIAQYVWEMLVGGHGRMRKYGDIRSAERCEAGSLLDCYDSANQLHRSEARAEGDLQTFEEILKRDVVFLIEDQDAVLGWISYRVMSAYLLVTGLYVRKTNQREGAGQRLLDFVIHAASGRGLSLCVLKVLKNAPWAVSFYQKNGFFSVELDSDDAVMQRDVELLLETTGLRKSNWSHLLVRLLS